MSLTPYVARVDAFARLPVKHFCVSFASPDLVSEAAALSVLAGFCRIDQLAPGEAGYCRIRFPLRHGLG
jgi:hypothetical protein